MFDQRLFLQTLADFTALLLAPYEVETVLAELADQVTDVLGLAGSGVSLARDDRLEFHTAYGSKVAVVERAQEQTQVGPCVSAYHSGQVVAVEELSSERHRWPEYCQTAAMVDISAVASVPLKLGDQAVGVLDLYARGPRDWPEEDIAAAVVMANMATAFLINASQHRQQAQLNEQLQHALTSRVLIEQAKGVLAARYHISLDEAFERLRNHARGHNTSVREVAEAVVQRRSLP